MNIPKEIIIHCSATKEGQNFDIKDVDRWHKDKGWKKCGYQIVVKMNGQIQFGRGFKEVGAHCTGHNSSSIGVCYIGGLDKNSKAADTRTAEQKQSLYVVVKMLCEAYGITEKSIYCHNQLTSKACPCFTKEVFMKEYREWLKENAV